MKKLPFQFLLFPVLATLPLFSHSETPITQQPSLNELQTIDQQIDSLNKELSKTRKDVINQEIHAQPYMIDNWQEFVDDIQHTEESEKEVQNIKQKIKTLQDRKNALLQPANKT